MLSIYGKKILTMIKCSRYIRKW